MDKREENFWNYEQAPVVGMSCPECDAVMRVEYSSAIMCSNPPQQRWYWECDCGYQRLGGVHRHEAVKMNVAI